MNPSSTAASRVLAAAGLLIALAVPPAGAQVLYGTMTGNVTDASGGLMPGATVKAVNADTGVSKSALSDEHGVFLFSDLVPGVYTVSFEISGFKTLVHKGVRIETNAVRRIDARLEVSGVEERVEVVAA